MNFVFFESMSLQQSQEFLKNYLEVEHTAVLDMIPMLKSKGIVSDFSIDSIPGFLKHVLQKIMTIPANVDSTVPAWIRETESYTKGLIEFDENSKPIVLAASYYMGESFVRNYKQLSWGIGKVDTAIMNMPVVTGFLYNIEMAPIMIVENLFLRILGDGALPTDIDKAINYWSCKYVSV